MSETPAAYRVVLVTGLSGAGKASTLRVLEDLGYDAVDNPPLSMIGALAERAARTGSAPVAIGVDARSDGFDATAVMAALDAIRRDHGLRTCLVFLWASEPALLRRFTATRRRHPLAGSGGRTVAEVLAVDRRIEPIEPHLATSGSNWEIEFFNSDRYNAARNGRSPGA